MRQELGILSPVLLGEQWTYGNPTNAVQSGFSLSCANQCIWWNGGNDKFESKLSLQPDDCSMNRIKKSPRGFTVLSIVSKLSTQRFPTFTVWTYN